MALPQPRPDLLDLSGTARLPTPHGDFRIRVLTDREGSEHVLLSRGSVEGAEDLPVRIHSECLTSEVFHSLRCDCREQLEAALEFLGRQAAGALIYLRQEGRGVGLRNKIEAYALQDSGLDTVEANLRLGLPPDSRTYDLAAHLLRDVLRVGSVRLLTNNPRKIDALVHHGLRVTGRIPLHVPPNPFNGDYLRVKRLKMQHLP